MRYLIAALIALPIFYAESAFSVKEAEAAVCARGVYRAGCVGPRGAVAVRRPPARAVIVR
ncbi:hypothetical protein [Methylocapsa aurea]|uniref:hypothetical protein n=1 Tax=Methylocapsa aurea TaxID=663610 RepID=UPI00056B128A|nr:hypothetical protein [Methylocapsa aurea]